MDKEGFYDPSRGDIEDYYKKGVIKKENLIDGRSYFGICRNAEIAKWDSKKNVFLYIRTKFNKTRIEEINHIADDNGYDLFIPVKLCG